MMDKMILQSGKGLPNILYTTFSAGDGIDQIGASTGNFGHAVVSQFGFIGKDFKHFIAETAISARCCVAGGEESLKRN